MIKISLIEGVKKLLGKIRIPKTSSNQNLYRPLKLFKIFNKFENLAWRKCTKCIFIYFRALIQIHLCPSLKEKKNWFRLTVYLLWSIMCSTKISVCKFPHRSVWPDDTALADGMWILGGCSSQWNNKALTGKKKTNKQKTFIPWPVPAWNLNMNS